MGAVPFCGYASIPPVDRSVEIVDAADSEFAALPATLRARLLRLLEMVEHVGLDQLREPHVRDPEGKLWEFRASLGTGSQGQFT